MAHSRLTTVLAASLLLSVAAIAQGTQNDKKASEPERSLGVSLAMPDGHFIAFPIQHENTVEKMAPVPIPGYKNFFGIKMYPYMTGDKVAVRILALVPEKQGAGASEQSDPTKVPHEHQLVGDYILGKVDDTVQVTGLVKFGLPALTAKVVLAPFLADSTDPCCCTSGGLFCCGRTFVIMCANCPCPTCGNLKSPEVSKAVGAAPSSSKAVSEPKRTSSSPN